MVLRFYAREDRLAYTPGDRKTYGQAPNYIGREFTPGNKSTPATYPAAPAPQDVDIDTSTTAGAQTLNRYAKLVRDGAIWCADPATAAACGAKFVPVVHFNGAWVQKAGK